jgi:chromosome segregation ATPase
MDDELNALIRRMDAYERHQSDNAKTISAMIDNSGSMEKRIALLEASYNDGRVDRAQRDARLDALQTDMSAIKEDIRSIKGVASRFLWIVATGVVVAFLGFILKGGPLGG